jgi:hypothetical protein
MITLSDRHSHTHTQTHTLGKTSLDEGSAHRSDLYLTTHNNQETDNHATGEIRTHNPSKRKVEDYALNRAEIGIGNFYDLTALLSAIEKSAVLRKEGPFYSRYGPDFA